MKVEMVSIGSYQKKLQILVPAADVKSELDKAYRNLRGQARLQGFRPGKAPRRVLEMRFGPQVTADVANNLIQAGYAQGLKDFDLEPVARPSVDSNKLESSVDFEFTITVDVKPEVELEQYTGVDVVYPSVEVKEEEIEAAVKQALVSQSRLVEVEDRAIESGDKVIVDLTLFDGDEAVAQEPGTMIDTNSDLWYPGLEAVLVGMSKDEEKTEEVTFAEGIRNETVAGKTLKAQLKVMSIQTRVVPELDDDVAGELGYEGGAEGMKNAIRGRISSQREELARNQARANLLQALIEANKFEIPGPMIESNLQMLQEELKLQHAYRGGDPRTLTFSEAQIADLRTRAEFAAKGALILEYVSSKESIEVQEEDLEAKYQEIADQRGQSIEAIRGYFVKDEAVQELSDRLLEEKTLDWLLERANLVAPSTEEASEE